MRTRRPAAAMLLGAATAAAVVVLSTAHAGAAFSRGGALPGLGSGHIWSVAASPVTQGLLAAGTDKGVFTSTDNGSHWSITTLDDVRVWSVGFDARDPHKLFAGTDGDGIKVSTDSGGAWLDQSTGLPDMTVRCLAFGLDGLAAGTNRGVALSADGVTWHDGGLEPYSVSSLAVAANAPALVLVAATDRGDASTGYLFRYSSTAAGWQPLQSGLPSSAVATSVASGPLSSSVTKRPLLVTTSKGTFRSGDGGSTWTASTGVPDTLTLTAAAFSPLDPSVVYAGADQGGSNGGDLMRSTDGGTTFSAFHDGLPNSGREVESIAVAQTTPPQVSVAVDPASGGVVFGEADTTAPAPPPLVAEAPGQPIPSTLPTLPSTATPSAAVAPAATPSSTGGGIGQVAGTVFHWPVPLVFEVLLVLAVAYVVVRWRQRYYVEGPP